MGGWEIAAAIIFGLLVNEFTDISPWLALRLVRWAAYRWSPDADQRAAYADEWAAIIEERPGKLLKLLTAVGFTCGALRRTIPRHVCTIQLRLSSRLRSAGPRLSSILSLVLNGSGRRSGLITLISGVSAAGAAISAFWSSTPKFLEVVFMIALAASALLSTTNLRRLPPRARRRTGRRRVDGRRAYLGRLEKDGE